MKDHSAAPLPAESRAHTRLPLRSPAPRVYVGGDPIAAPPRPHRRTPRRAVFVCLALALVLGAVLLPALRSLDSGITLRGFCGSLGQVLLQGGLPPTDQPILGGGVTGDGGDAVPPDETDRPAEPPESLPQDGDESRDPTAPTEEDSLPPAEPADTVRPPDGNGDFTTSALPAPDTEPVSENAGAVPAPPESEDPDTPTDTPPGSADTEKPDPPAESEPLPIPDGCIPMVSKDMSEADRGAGYIHNTGDSLPPTLPADSPWQSGRTAVLIVNTHPYEGYSDGGGWYDPAAGGLAQTDSPNDPDGVVALGSTLARTLRGMGVTVIHLRVATSSEESAAEIYDRTEAMIRYYCRLYPDIGLVIDLRRSAELTEEGGILRTEGRYDGAPCAQLRISVNGGRDTAALGYDLAAALALRESLWEMEPTLCRPVWVRSGKGLVSDLTDVRVLTLEMGSAGNTLDDARRPVSLLSRALADILQNID